MANQFTEALSKRYGPLPGYGWAGVAAGGLAIVLYIKKKASPPPAASSTSAASSRYTSPGAQIPGVLPAYQPMSTAPTSPPASSSDSGAAAVIPVPVATALDSGTRYSGHEHQVPLYGPSKDSSGVTAWVPTGTKMRVAGAITPYGVPCWYIGTQVLAPADLVSVDYVSPSQAPPGQTGAGGGRGGSAASARGGPSIGSRSARLNHYAHPDIKRAPRFSHFVRHPGGIATHGPALASAASSAGVHPARLRMLNPPARGYLRIA